MEKIHTNMHVLCLSAYSLKVNMKAQEDASFHVFSPSPVNCLLNHNLTDQAKRDLVDRRSLSFQYLINQLCH